MQGFVEIQGCFADGFLSETDPGKSQSVVP